MVTFLVTSLFILVLVAVVAVYFSRKPTNTAQSELLPPPPNRLGLFPEGILNQEVPTEGPLSATKRAEILSRADTSDLSTLQEAQSFGDADFYNEVLNSLVRQSHGPKLLALASYISRHELSVNKSLAEKSLEAWRSAPARGSTAKMLHLAALSDDAGTYEVAVDAVMRCWRSGALVDISAQELRSLVEGEFWVLSSSARSSGEGFVLKRTLANARRELEAAAEQ